MGDAVTTGGAGYAAALGLDPLPPSSKRSEAPRYLDLLIELLVREGPLSPDDAAHRLSAKGIESRAGNLRSSIARSWRGRAPVVRDEQGRYDLDLASPELPAALARIGLSSRSTVEAPDRRRPLCLSVMPSGRFQLHQASESLEEADGVEAGPALRIEDAFHRTDAEGLLHLATVERRTALPPSLVLGRRLAAEFLHALCALPEDGTTARDIRSISLPETSLESLAEEAPFMRGAEYLTTEVLQRVIGRLAHHVADRMTDEDLDLPALLAGLEGDWHALGRVWFHLAENKEDKKRPFAFLATYTLGMSEQQSLRHAPLGRALEEMRGDRTGLLRLIAPVKRASEKSPIVGELLESGQIFHPLAWTATEAYEFLEQAERLDGTGVMLRLPKSWSGKPRSPKVEVRIGETTTSIGARALLGFDVALALDGRHLTAAEKRKILRGTRRLEWLRGRWVEVDPAQLRETLDAWADRKEIGFQDALRVLAEVDERPGAAQFASVVAGERLEQILEELRGPSQKIEPSRKLKATLRPYQKEGLSWLWLLHQLGLGGCLADDMGLGKTIQVIALLLRMREERIRGQSLIVVPASVVGNWKRELKRFAPSLKVFVAHRSEHPGADLEEALSKLPRYQVVLTTYATLTRLEPLTANSWALVVLDEAQAIKNASTRQSKTVKKLDARARLALTGTPIENRLGDLWSLFDFLNPGLLGRPQEFSAFLGRMKQADTSSYAPLRRLVRPYLLRRLKTDRRIAPDLPDKTEVDVYCPLSKAQATLYEEAVRKLAEILKTVEAQERRGVILAFLTRFKQICNHPSHWLGDGTFAPKESGKFLRLREIATSIAERQEKLLLFTQYRAMTGPLAAFLKAQFNREGLVLHGGTPVKKRTEMVESFQNEDGPPFFVLSLKAGGTGLNLTSASHVIHFDRWWNPAVENQATDRAYRIGQHANVLVHRFVCRGTLEERIHRLLEEKRALADEILRLDGAKALTEMSNTELLNMVRLDMRTCMERE